MAGAFLLAFICLVSFTQELDGFSVRNSKISSVESVNSTGKDQDAGIFITKLSKKRTLISRVQIGEFNLENAIVKPAECDAYLREQGCSWTSQYRCPPDSNGVSEEESALPLAMNDGSVGYRCCCDLGLYRADAAWKGAAVVLKEKANRCNELSQHNDQLVTCDFTGDYACPEQFRSDHHVADAGGINDDGYMCCCVLGQWRNKLKNSLRDFQSKLQDESTIRNKLMFVNIPANAGTDIEEASGDSSIWYPRKWPSFAGHNVLMPDGSTCEKAHVPPAYLYTLHEQDQDAFRTQGTFCVTQHPYERAVSEYLYQVRVEWGPSMSEQYRTGLLEYPKCTAKGLNFFLQSALQKVQEGRKFLHDCHFVPQHEFIYGHDGRKWCNNLLRIDTLQRDFNELMTKHGDEARIAQSKMGGMMDECKGNITARSLTAETKLLLQEVYADDFELLDYAAYD